MQQPQFGKKPSGSRLEILKASPNFKNGKFQNIHHTPAITEGYNYFTVLYEFFFKREKHRTPPLVIPSIKTDLLSLEIDENVLIWFGHSSYFIQINGKRFLVDPVFSGNASPLRNSNKAFKGSDIYTIDDLPSIDYLLITHDHYDHADYKTLKQLSHKSSKVICGLGVGGHLVHWGFNEANIIEKDWDATIHLDDDITIHTAPTRHFFRAEAS